MIFFWRRGDGCWTCCWNLWLLSQGHQPNSSNWNPSWDLQCSGHWSQLQQLPQGMFWWVRPKCLGSSSYKAGQLVICPHFVAVSGCWYRDQKPSPSPLSHRKKKYLRSFSFIPQIAIAIGVLTSNGGWGRRTTLADWTWHQGAIVVCYGWGGWRPTLGEWTWCHCRVSL